MSKKDFKAIAKILNGGCMQAKPEHSFGSNETVLSTIVIDDMADYLANTNPRFDRERFLAACGVK